jgi:hypothetical protein
MEAQAVMLVGWLKGQGMAGCTFNVLCPTSSYKFAEGIWRKMISLVATKSEDVPVRPNSNHQSSSDAGQTGDTASSHFRRQEHIRQQE